MISSVHIQNWRSIENLDVPLSALTALVGANGVGKTGFIQAIDFALGSRWPGMSYLDIPRDFYMMDPSKPLSIRCGFDPHLVYSDAMGTEWEVGYLEYRCKPYLKRVKDKEAGDLHDDFVPLSPSGEHLTVAVSPPRRGKPPEFAPLLRVSSGLRDQARVLAISDRRSVSVHASGRRGSVLNLLLSSARRDFARDTGGTRSTFGERYEQALLSLRTDAVKEIEDSISETAKQMLGFLGQRSVADLSISFGFADPANPFGSLSIMCKEGDIELPAEMMGLGIQSAIVIGVFEALRRTSESLGTILLEEPEIYLHPQAQRYFHRLLLDMVDQNQCQVIYTTHSPIFADMTRYDGIKLLRKRQGSTRATWIARTEDAAYLEDQLKREKLRQYMDPAASEALFARRVLLVEGQADYLAARAVATKLACDLDAEGLSVIACRGKSAIPFFARMCRALSIPAFVLHDSDQYTSSGPLTQWQLDQNARAPKENEAIKEALDCDERLFVVDPTLEEALGISHEARDKPMRVADVVESLSVDEMPAALAEAVQALIG